MRRWYRLKLPRHYRVRRTDKVLAFCVAFLTGLVVARLHLSLSVWFVVVCAALAATAAKKPVLHIILLVLFGLSLGIWRGSVYLAQLAPYHEFAGKTVTLMARVSLDAVYGTNKQLSFEAKKVRFTSPRDVSVPGTIRVGGFGELAIYRGDVVQITGKLYPTRGGKQATISYAQIERLYSEQTWVDGFRRSFASGMQTALPEPQASFGLGLLIGQRNTLPFTINQALLMVGLTHIIAVSGYNLTIILNAARKIFEKRSKFLMMAFAIGLMTFFLFLTGASASIVRAAVVSGLGLGAWYYGRTVRPMVLLLLAAAMTTYATPTYFWSDISWWLSLLAFFGILVIAPQISERLFRGKSPSALTGVAVETLCAELMTIPLVMFIFGQVSLIGLLANMLVVLFIPLAMLFSAIAAIVGMLAPMLAGWLAWPATLLLTYMLDTATLLSRIPHIFQANVYLSLADMVLCYGMILFALAAVYRRKAQWFDKLG